MNNKNVSEREMLFKKHRDRRKNREREIVKKQNE